MSTPETPFDETPFDERKYRDSFEPMKPSALPETDALPKSDEELADRLVILHRKLSSFVGYPFILQAAKRLRALAAATEDKPNYHRQMGITLLDAKYLDPACHKGCQSLVHQAKLAAATEEKAEYIVGWDTSGKNRDVTVVQVFRKDADGKLTMIGAGGGTDGKIHFTP